MNPNAMPENNAPAKNKMENRKLDESAVMIERYMDAIPHAEGNEKDLRDEERGRIELLEKRGLPSAEIAEIVRRDVDLVKMSYQDRRPCFKEALFNRRYIEAEIAKKIEKIDNLSAEKAAEAKKRIAVINFDLNGLKALNDVGGHAAGDEGLRIFAEILQKGETANSLRKEWGIDVIPYTQGGDEFGMLLSSETADIGEIKEKVKNMIIKEIVGNEKGRKILKLDKEAVKKLRDELGAEIPEGFEFKLGASIGISTLSDAEKEEWLDKKIEKDREKFGQLKISEKDDNFAKMRKLRDRMILLSDDLAIENKQKTKQQIKETGKITLSDGAELDVGKELYTLYNIRSADEVKKEREMEELKRQLDCLRGKASNEDLTECKAS